MQYEVVAPIARGGMGTVDLARTPGGRSVALKRLALHGSAEQMRAARARLEREAELLVRLDHPAVVELVEVIDDGGEVVLVMPYLPGGTLADRVVRQGPCSSRETLELAHRLLGALAAAHRAGVVHRDVKPANVLFDEEGEAQLADFGVATTRDATPGLTATGLVVGTPGYLSPEQARGEPATQASDVFALGATLLFAATGAGPFGTGDPRVVLYRAAKDQVGPVPRSLDPALRRLLRPMLDARPERRPSAAELAAGPDGTLVLPRARRRRRGLVAAAAVAAAAVLAGIGALAATGGDDTEPPGRAGSPVTAPEADPCTPLPYQPCGADQPAPNTDGRRCIGGHDDYDGVAGNGCEAAPIGPADGSELVDRVEANIVPADDLDTYAVHVRDDRNLLCDGTLVLGLTAPPGTTLRLDAVDGDGDELGAAVSADGVRSELELVEPDCFGDDSTTLEVRVSPVGSDRSEQAYVLTRRGNY